MDELITKYLQGEASEDEKRDLLRWLREDESNRKEFVEIRDVWLASGPAAHLDEDYASKAFHRFASQVEARDNRRSASVRWILPFRRIAAAVILLVACSVGGYYAGKYNEAQLQASAPERIVNSVLTQGGTKSSVTLPDGTVAWLNSNSRLFYPEHFDECKRTVRLEGEGYFEVVRDEKCPFYVETNGMVVNVLGTRFDVKNYENSDVTETTLLSGKVEVTFPKSGKRVVLQPNQKIQSNKQSGDYLLSNVDAHDYIVWINDKLVFDNDRLSDIFSRMERWYNIRIICDKNVRTGQRLSFTIRNESKEEILKLLGLIAPVTYKVEGDCVTVRSK